ncbi:arylsulfatase K isoform X1 [Choloepus didactylus]|uniref:arylsulfatase K isoform X1 n=2 Tax=Choloepus didactylus TaxID=27675 RepID=UPI00189FF750|nr:arylsulfatase K isoform X1 [Choloepus didactylus]
MLLLWMSVVSFSALAARARGAGGQSRRATPAWSKAPNVVLVMSDSLDGRLTFQPGSRVVKLPFISFMKAHGTSFLNAYTNSPICCPSRAAMWSGLFAHLTESWNNFKGLDPNYTTWMDVMEKHGYRTQKFGKLDYTSGHHSISNRVEAWTRDVDFLLTQEGRPMVNLIPNKTKVRVMEKDWKNTDTAVNWLKKKAINYTQPFVLYLGLNLPHPYPSPSSGENFGSSTFHTSLYWLDKVSYNAIKVPKWSPLSEMHPIDHYSSYTKNCTGKFTKKEIKNIRAFYYAMCAETDAMLGEIILALHQTDLIQKTTVIFTSDHGELAMEHRQFYKMSMYEASAHVPLLMMGPGIKANLQVANVVSLVDIYPTMLDIAGIPLPQNLSGYSLLPLSSENFKNDHKFKHPRPPWILSEFHGCNVNASTYMLRTNQWKYIAYSDGTSVLPQLFDLSSDPDELTNIATKFPEITYSLDQKLRSIINYPKVSAFVHQYNKEQFINWKQSVGQNYSNVIANLRWHQDWLKEPRKYENAIDQWLKTHTKKV